VNAPLSFAGAQWIWCPEGNPSEDAPVAKRFFRRGFELFADKRVAGARLRVSCDDRCAVWLNGQALGEHADWKTGREFAGLEKILRAGHNTLAIEGENRPAPVTKNPAGLLSRLEVQFSDGATMRVDSDDAWQVAKTAMDGWQRGDFDAHNWAAPKLLGAYGCAPWGEVTSQTEQAPPLCAGITDGLRLVYLLEPHTVEISALKVGTRYTFEWFDPVYGVRQNSFGLAADAQGKAVVTPPTDDLHDWALVVKPEKP
jgi:alpha-L-rhamnosidase